MVVVMYRRSMFSLRLSVAPRQNANVENPVKFGFFRSQGFTFHNPTPSDSPDVGFN